MLHFHSHNANIVVKRFTFGKLANVANDTVKKFLGRKASIASDGSVQWLLREEIKRKFMAVIGAIRPVGTASNSPGLRTNQGSMPKFNDIERDYLRPLDCVDRYLRLFNREGLYGTVSSGPSDREGRWQAFIDYSNSYHRYFRNKAWMIEKGIDEDEVGAIEDANFRTARTHFNHFAPKRVFQSNIVESS